MPHNINKLEQYFWVDWFGKQTVEIKDRKVTRTYRNIFSEYSVDYDIKDIDSHYSIGRMAYDSWGNLSWFFFLALLIYFVITKNLNIDPFVDISIILLCFLFAFVFFLFRFKKYKYVYFSDNNKNILLSIRVSSQRDEDFVDALVGEVEKTEENNN